MICHVSFSFFVNKPSAWLEANRTQGLCVFFLGKTEISRREKSVLRQCARTAEEKSLVSVISKMAVCVMLLKQHVARGLCCSPRKTGSFCRYRKALYFWSLGISLYLELFCFLSFITFVLRNLCSGTHRRNPKTSCEKTVLRLEETFRLVPYV